jgi:hypothetical protein
MSTIKPASRHTLIGIWGIQQQQQQQHSKISCPTPHLFIKTLRPCQLCRLTIPRNFCCVHHTPTNCRYSTHLDNKERAQLTALRGNYQPHPNATAAEKTTIRRPLPAQHALEQTQTCADPASTTAA